jgi:hypothetical protein
MPEPQIELTESRRAQLRAFVQEQDASDARVNLRPAQNLAIGYVEAVLLDADGEPTSTKRVLFPQTGSFFAFFRHFFRAFFDLFFLHFLRAAARWPVLVGAESVAGVAGGAGTT